MRTLLPAVIAAACAPVHAQTQLYELRGDNPFDLFGSTLAALGDVDGDGFADFIVGTHDNVAPHDDFARVFSGRTGQVIRELREGAAFVGFGFAVAAAGDLDGDGFADFLVGAPLTSSGSAYAYSGRTGAQLFSFSGDAPGDEFGGALAGAGDLNHDGVPDVIVGAYYADPNGPSSGLARAFSGADGSILFTWNGAHAGDVLGGVVAAAGDVDLDGFDDVIVSAPGDGTNGSHAGSLFIFSGRDGSTLAQFFGENAGDFFGRSAASIGDVDGDGRPDVAIGAPFNGANGSSAGAVYVFSAVGGPPRFVVHGTHATAQLGFSVAAAGDVDGDGRPDWIAGAHLDDSGADPNENSGSARAYSGQSGAELMVLHGASGEHFGAAVAGALDVNGDGRADLVVGGFATTSADTRGVVRVFSGTSCGPCFPVGLAYCFGHDGGTPCPCGNSTPPGSGQGCAHSLGYGARLDASGNASVAGDSIVLTANLLPPGTTGVFIQGTQRAQNGVVFGDGLLCVSGSIVRLGTKSAPGGAMSYPGAGDPPVSVRGGVVAGDLRHYQLWFRNGASFCTSAAFNLTNGLTIAWL